MRISKYDILIIDLNPTLGFDQQGVRPVLVVQTNRVNRFSPTTVVCPISSVLKQYPHHFIVEPSTENGLYKKSRVDLLQIRTIDQSRIVKKIGTLESKYWYEFKGRFVISFDLEDYFTQ
jgi:mRNA interferase MazF